MRKGRLTAPGLIDPVVPLDEGPAVWELIKSEPDKVEKHGIKHDLEPKGQKKD
jgi:hypothetical protein